MRGVLIVVALLCHTVDALRLNAWHSRHRAAQALRCRAAVAQEVDPAIYEGIGASPSEWLASNADEDLAVVLEALLASCAQIATKVRTAACDSEEPPEEYWSSRAIFTLKADALAEHRRRAGAASSQGPFAGFGRRR